MLKFLGMVGEGYREGLNEYMRSFELVEDKYFGKKTGRFCKWFGLGVELGENKVFEGEKIDERLRVFGNRVWGGEDWNSVLLYRYGVGVGINRHRDRKCFDNKVVVVGNVDCDFGYGKSWYVMKGWGIYEFDSKRDHEIKGVSEERLVLQFRKVI